jgi:hypothetical protein
MPRPPVLALVLLIAACLLGTLTSADARSKPACALKKSKTYKQNKSVRLFARGETRDGLFVRALYGCHRRTNKRVFLATKGGYNPDDYWAKLRGRFVAVNYTETDTKDPEEPAHHSGFLRVWDLKRPKRVTAIRDVEATDIELGPKGQLFWIGRPLVDGDKTQPLSVYAGKRALATGNIAPKSLVLGARSTVYWTQDGARRCAGPACGSGR